MSTVISNILVVIQ